MLFVVDDLQWTDADSLRLIEHAAGDLGATSALLLVTTRPLDDESPAALVDCLGELARSAGSTHVALTGLTAPTSPSGCTVRTDAAVSDEVAELVHDRTGGHPLFVKELTDLLAAEGRLDDPISVRDATLDPARGAVRRAAPSRSTRPGDQPTVAHDRVGGRAARSTSTSWPRSWDHRPMRCSTPSARPSTPAWSSRTTSRGAIGSRTRPGRRSPRGRAERGPPGPGPRGHGRGADRPGRRGPRRRRRPHRLPHAPRRAGRHARAGRRRIDPRSARQAERQLAFEVAADHWSRVVDTLAQRRPADRNRSHRRADGAGHGLIAAELVDRAKAAVLAAIDLAEKAGDPARMGRGRHPPEQPQHVATTGLRHGRRRRDRALERTIAGPARSMRTTPGPGCCRPSPSPPATCPGPSEVDRITGRGLAEARAGDDPLTAGPRAGELLPQPRTTRAAGRAPGAMIAEIFDGDRRATTHPPTSSSSPGSATPARGTRPPTSPEHARP